MRFLRTTHPWPRVLALTLSLTPAAALAQPRAAVGVTIAPPALPVPPSLPGLPAVPVPVPPPPVTFPVPPPPLAVPVAPAVPVRTTLVRLQANDLHATLSRFSGQETRRYWGRHGSYLRRIDLYSPVCRTPCEVAVDLDDYYEIRGLNVNPSPVFQLPSLPAVDLNVRVGHSGTRVGGVLLTSLGSIPLIVGLVFTPIGAALYDHSDGPGFLITGGITLGVGTALVAGGIYMLANSRTRVWTSDGYRLAARSQPHLALSAAGLHF